MTILDQARMALRQGDKQTAKNILANLVRQEPQNAEAWILMAEVVDDPKQKAFCQQRAQALAGDSRPIPASIVSPSVTSPAQPASKAGLEDSSSTTDGVVGGNTASQMQSPKTSQPGNALKKFLSEEQDPGVVRQVFARVKQIITSGEEILYIAVQKNLVNFSPDCVVLTNKRFIVYRPKMLGGVNFEDYIWRDLKDAQLSEGIVHATLVLHTVAGAVIRIEHLPKAQARKLYSFAQEMEENVREQRRARDLEDKRAAAGGILLQSAPSLPQMSAPSSQEDPVQKLKKLKSMLDEGLITSQEYETKKTDILSRL